MPPCDCVFHDTAACFEITKRLASLEAGVDDLKAGQAKLVQVSEQIRLELAETRGVGRAQREMAAKRQRWLAAGWACVRGVAAKFVTILA